MKADKSATKTPSVRLIFGLLDGQEADNIVPRTVEFVSKADNLSACPPMCPVGRKDGGRTSRLLGLSVVRLVSEEAPGTWFTLACLYAHEKRGVR